MWDDPGCFAFVVCTQDRPGLKDSPATVVGRAQIMLDGNTARVCTCFALPCMQNKKHLTPYDVIDLSWDQHYRCGAARRRVPRGAAACCWLCVPRDDAQAVRSLALLALCIFNALVAHLVAIVMSCNVAVSVTLPKTFNLKPKANDVCAERLVIWTALMCCMCSRHHGDTFSLSKSKTIISCLISQTSTSRTQW